MSRDRQPVSLLSSVSGVRVPLCGKERSGEVRDSIWLRIRAEFESTSGDSASIHGKAFDMRSGSGPLSSTATPMSWAANWSIRVRFSASRCDMSTSDSPPRPVTVTGWPSASANTANECLLRSEERRSAGALGRGGHTTVLSGAYSEVQHPLAPSIHRCTSAPPLRPLLSRA